MSFSNGLADRSISGRRRQSASLSDKKRANGDWLAAKVASYRVSDIVELTGMTERAVHNVRQRKSKLSYDNLVELCQNDPDFAAAFASHVGLILPGQVEFVGALTRAVNAAQRMKGSTFKDERG